MSAYVFTKIQINSRGKNVINKAIDVGHKHTILP